MKYFNLLTIALLCTVVTFCACNDSADARKQEAKDALVVPENPSVPTATTPPVTPTPEPAQNAEGVWHYTCTAGCEGGAGAAGTCPKCGDALAHNAAYHGTPPATTTLPGGDSPIKSITPPTPPTTPEPAQNAAGVWHYTCGAGCAGGAGSAGTCSSCGGALAHNAAYHN